jgi:hypothetical protein
MIPSRETSRDKIRRFFPHIFSLLILTAWVHLLIRCTIAPIRGGEIKGKVSRWLV